MAAGCFNTPSNHVSVFKFPRDGVLRQKWEKQVQSTRSQWKAIHVPCIHFFIASTSQMNVWRLTKHLLLTLGWTKGGGWSMEWFQQYFTYISHIYPRLRCALARVRRDGCGKGQLENWCLSNEWWWSTLKKKSGAIAANMQRTGIVYRKTSCYQLKKNIAIGGSLTHEYPFLRHHQSDISS